MGLDLIRLMEEASLDWSGYAKGFCTEVLGRTILTFKLWYLGHNTSCSGNLVNCISNLFWHSKKLTGKPLHLQIIIKVVGYCEKLSRNYRQSQGNCSRL
jgi:hypothetical protein